MNEGKLNQNESSESGKEKQEFTVITLPENPEIVNRLNYKLEDYKKRSGKQGRILSKFKFLAGPETADTKYKLLILEKLLKDGKVDAEKIKVDLYGKDDTFVPSAFQNAFNVIKNYAEEGGEDVLTGPGRQKF